VPLFILWLGIFEASKVALIAVGVFFPVYLGVAGAILSVDPQARRSRARVPAVPLRARAPHPPARRSARTLISLRAGLGLGFMFVVAQSTWEPSEGLGYLAVDGQHMESPTRSSPPSSPSRSLGKTADSLLVVPQAPGAGRTRRGSGCKMLPSNASKTYADGTRALRTMSSRCARARSWRSSGGLGLRKTTLLRLSRRLDRAERRARSGLDGETIEEPHRRSGLCSRSRGFSPGSPSPTMWASVSTAFRRQSARAGSPTPSKRSASPITRAAGAGTSPGGQQQRVAIARAFVTNPKVLLLDEPFSALDAFTRASLHEHLLALWDETRPIVVLVTHDVAEAVTLADRVIVMRPNPGRIDDELPLGLARPRDRAGLPFETATRRVMHALDESLRDLSGKLTRQRDRRPPPSGGSRFGRSVSDGFDRASGASGPVEGEVPQRPRTRRRSPSRLKGPSTTSTSPARSRPAGRLPSPGLHPGHGGSGAELCSGDMLLEAPRRLRGRDPEGGLHRPRNPAPQRHGEG
jgi:sulfonate transport system ATP-binding protein